MHDRLAAPLLLNVRSRAVWKLHLLLTLIWVSIVFSVALLPCASLCAQAPDVLRIQILSGKTGRPVVNTHIVLFRSAKLDALDNAKTNAGEITDGEGYAAIPATEAETVLARVDFHVACTKSSQTFSLMDVRAKGVVSENICSKRIKLYPQVGTLVLFVRDETFFEKMRH